LENLFSRYSKLFFENMYLITIARKIQWNYWFDAREMKFIASMALAGRNRIIFQRFEKKLSSIKWFYQVQRIHKQTKDCYHWAQFRQLHHSQKLPSDSSYFRTRHDCSNPPVPYKYYPHLPESIGGSDWAVHLWRKTSSGTSILLVWHPY